MYSQATVSLLGRRAVLSVIVRMKTPILGSREVRNSRTGQRLSRLRHWAGPLVEAEDRKRPSNRRQSPIIRIVNRRSHPSSFILTEPTHWASAGRMGSLLSIPATDADLLSSPDANDSRSLRTSEGYTFTLYEKLILSWQRMMTSTHIMSRFEPQVTCTDNNRPRPVTCQQETTKWLYLNYCSTLKRRTLFSGATLC